MGASVPLHMEAERRTDQEQDGHGRYHRILAQVVRWSERLLSQNLGWRWARRGRRDLL